MRFVMMTVSVVVLLMAVAVAADEKPRCEQCGMFYENSPTQVSAVITVGDKSATHLFESLGCFNAYLTDNFADNTDVEVVKVMVLDYTTFGTKKPVMLDAAKAQFLYGTESLKGSMAPFIAAFATPKAALNAVDELDGEVLEYDEVMTRIAGDGAGGCGSCAGCKGCPKGGSQSPNDDA